MGLEGECAGCRLASIWVNFCQSQGLYMMATRCMSSVMEGSHWHGAPPVFITSGKHGLSAECCAVCCTPTGWDLATYSNRSQKSVPVASPVWRDMQH